VRRSCSVAAVQSRHAAAAAAATELILLWLLLLLHHHHHHHAAIISFTLTVCDDSIYDSQDIHDLQDIYNLKNGIFTTQIRKCLRRKGLVMTQRTFTALMTQGTTTTVLTVLMTIYTENYTTTANAV
jgi:hypothetical protein